MLLNVISLVASLAALAISTFLAARQSRLMRHANEVPVLMAIFNQYSSAEFQGYDYYITRQLAAEHSPELGFMNLPEEARTAATSIATFFTFLGTLLLHGLADESVVIHQIGYRAMRAWSALEPYIIGERKLRGDDNFASPFEDFVCRIRDNWPPETAYRLRMKKMTAEPRKSEKGAQPASKTNAAELGGLLRPRYPMPLAIRVDPLTNCGITGGAHIGGSFAAGSSAVSRSCPSPAAEFT